MEAPKGLEHKPAFTKEEIARQELNVDLGDEVAQIESTATNEEVSPPPHVPPEIVQEIIKETDPSAQ